MNKHSYATIDAKISLKAVMRAGMISNTSNLSEHGSIKKQKGFMPGDKDKRSRKSGVVENEYCLSGDLQERNERKSGHRRSFTDPSQLAFFRDNPCEHTLVVIPSLDVDNTELKRVFDFSMCGYEERQLFHLFFLDNPNTRVIYVTSTPVNEHIVRYYLSLHGNYDLQDRLSRLLMLSPNDPSASPLSAKLLSRPGLVKLMQESIGQDEPDLSVFTGSTYVEKLASSMRAHLLEAPVSCQYYGTKQGSRELFTYLNIPHPPGTPCLPRDKDLLTHCSDGHSYICSTRALAIGLARQIVLDGIRPGKWIIKLNQGFSGKGNAILDLAEIGQRTYGGESSEKGLEMMAQDIEAAFPNMDILDGVWETTDDTVGFCQEISRLGVIGEAFLEGSIVTSPSFQGFIESPGVFRVLSTHEQILEEQVFMGCKFPAYHNYRKELIGHGIKIGNHLASKGVLGHFSADFLALGGEVNSGGCNLFAIEINLRQGT